MLLRLNKITLLYYTRNWKSIYTHYTTTTKALNHPAIMFIISQKRIILLDASLNLLEYSKLFADSHKQSVHLGLLQMGDHD